MPTISRIIEAIEEFAPLALQESFDNSGLQVGDPQAEATGVLLCVDATEAVVAEAAARGINLVVTHHPLLFRGLKCVAGRTRPERVLAAAIRAGVTIYSAHTSADSTLGGVSWCMAQMLGLTDIATLVPVTAAGEGLGAVGNLRDTLSLSELAALVKEAFGTPVLRMSAAPWPADERVYHRLALCGGAGADDHLIPAAIAAEAQAYITADVKHNYFLDYAHTLLIIDAGHYETERCVLSLLASAIRRHFHNLIIDIAQSDNNPINYI